MGRCSGGGSGHPLFRPASLVARCLGVLPLPRPSTDPSTACSCIVAPGAVVEPDSNWTTLRGGVRTCWRVDQYGYVPRTPDEPAFRPRREYLVQEPAVDGSVPGRA